MVKTNAVQTATELLLNSGLGSFNFGTLFALRFDRESAAWGPWCVELRLDCEWWFGERSEWDQRVSELGPSDLPDPEEAVQAFDLVRLRWSTGSRVEQVQVENGTLRLRFSNGMVLSATTEEPDESWEIVEPGKSVEECDCAVLGSHEGILAKKPEAP